MRFFRVMLATGSLPLSLAACGGGGGSAPSLPLAGGLTPAEASRVPAAAAAAVAVASAADATRAVAVAPSGDAASADGTPNVAGTYDGTVAITRGGRTENGTLKVVIAQSAADISGTNTVDVPTLKTKGTETGTVARTSTGAVAVTISFVDRKGLGTGTAHATLVSGELSATDVEFYVYKRPTGTVSFHVKKT